MAGIAEKGFEPCRRIRRLEHSIARAIRRRSRAASQVSPSYRPAVPRNAAGELELSVDDPGHLPGIVRAFFALRSPAIDLKPEVARRASRIFGEDSISENASTA